MDQLTEKISKRGAEIIELKKFSSTFSAAVAVCDHMKDWILGSKEGEWVSMGIFPPDDCEVYGLPNNIVFSAPCITKDGQIEICRNISCKEDILMKMKENVNEINEQIQIGTETLNK